MSSRAMQNGRSWVKKRNLGQKNETRARKPGFSALSLRVSIERGAEFGKIFSGWQIILLRHTGDFQKSVLIDDSSNSAWHKSCPQTSRAADSNRPRTCTWRRVNTQTRCLRHPHLIHAHHDVLARPRRLRIAANRVAIRAPEACEPPALPAIIAGLRDRR